MPRYEFEVSFKVATTTVVAEAASLKEAWERRYELAGVAEPGSWEVEPYTVVELPSVGGDA